MGNKASGFWKDVFVVTAVLVVGTVLRCWNINQSFWWDEFQSTLPHAKAATLRILVCDLGYYFNNHVLYSLLCRFSMQLLGESEFSARLPALVMGIASIWFLFLFAKRSLGRFPAAICAFLFALSAFHIDHSTEARGYTGLVFCSLVSTYYFLKALSANTPRDWACHIVFVVAGFYFHPFMMAVSVSHFCCALVFFAAGLLKFESIGVRTAVFRNYVYAQVLAAISTIILYVPLLDDFYKDMQQVRIVDVDRLPFVLDLVERLFPGMLTLHGFVLYGTLFACGFLYVLKKNGRLFVLIVISMFVPISLYLSLNPMFVFQRYFLYALPLALMVLACGIYQLADLLKGVRPLRWVLVVMIVACLVLMQFAPLRDVLSGSRQNYREAVRYVEKSIHARQEALVFSIGYAGEFFGYYAQKPVLYPKTFAEFKEKLRGKKNVWCLLTGWLPELRPYYEDVDLYSEVPEHVKIYRYVHRHFVLKKVFHDEFYTQIFYLRRTPDSAAEML